MVLISITTMFNNEYDIALTNSNSNLFLLLFLLVGSRKLKNQFALRNVRALTPLHPFNHFRSNYVFLSLEQND